MSSFNRIFNALPLRRTLRLSLVAGFALLCVPSCQKDKDEEKDEDKKEGSDDDNKSSSDVQKRVTKICDAACSMKTCKDLSFNPGDDKCDDACSDDMKDILDDIKKDSCEEAFEDLMLCAFDLECSGATKVLDAFSKGKYSIEGDCEKEMDEVDEACGVDLSSMKDNGATVAGEEWTELYGLSAVNNEGQLRVLITDDKDVNCDSEWHEIENFVVFDVDAETGEYSSVPVQFVSGDEEYTDEAGKVLISELTDEGVVGAVYSELSKDNIFTSAFAIEYCKDE